MADFRGGKSEAANRLVELFYPELRRLAAQRMQRERIGVGILGLFFLFFGFCVF